MTTPVDPCPCGLGEVFGRCCLALHLGERHALSAEELMRSRYTAYALGNLEYVWRTWHPRTRPAEVSPATASGWTGLDIIDVVAGAAGDEHGEVEFRARRRTHGRTHVLHERSRFAKRAGHWLYVDGDLLN